MPLINFRLCALFWGSCRNITILRYCISGFLCRAFFREYGIGGDTANLVFIASSAISWGAEGMRNKAGSISLEKEGKIYIMQGFLLSNGTLCSLSLSRALFCRQQQTVEISKRQIALSLNVKLGPNAEGQFLYITFRGKKSDFKVLFFSATNVSTLNLNFTINLWEDAFVVYKGSKNVGGRIFAVSILAVAAVAITIPLHSEYSSYQAHCKALEAAPAPNWCGRSKKAKRPLHLNPQLLLPIEKCSCY